MVRTAGCPAASRARKVPMRPDPTMARPSSFDCMTRLPTALADGAHGVLGLLAVGVPPGAERIAVHVFGAATDARHGLQEFRILRRLGGGFAPDGDDRLWNLGLGEQAVPLVVLGLVAQLLQGRDVGKLATRFAPHGAERSQRAGARLRAADRGWAASSAAWLPSTAVSAGPPPAVGRWRILCRWP